MVSILPLALVPHICVIELDSIGSDNGLRPGRYQAIIWTNARILLISQKGTKFIDILMKMHIFSFKIMFLKVKSGKWQFYLDLKVFGE